MQDDILNYIVAGCKPWNKRVFDQAISKYPGKWVYIDNPDELTFQWVAALQPRYIFFLHWSWLVDHQIVNNFECVCFHMTDVPYGRGGSPLQNLILEGHTETMLTALRMSDDIDAGPVFLKRPLCLHGTAEEILMRASHESAKMIEAMIVNNPVPIEQEGKVVKFVRRTPKQSVATNVPSLEKLYDFIRMLDAHGYPRACILHEGFRYEFRRAALYDGRIEADVTITPISGNTA